MATTNRLMDLRKAAGLSRARLARELGGPPYVDQHTIYRWEKGRNGIPDERKLQLAAYFDVDVPHLMGWPERQAA